MFYAQSTSTVISGRGLRQADPHLVQELCESRGGRPGLSVLASLLVSVDVKLYWTILRHWSQISYVEPYFGIGLSLSLICQLTFEDIKQHYIPAGWLRKRKKETEKKTQRIGSTGATKTGISMNSSIPHHSRLKILLTTTNHNNNNALLGNLKVLSANNVWEITEHAR